MPKLPTHFLSQAALEVIEQHFSHHLGVVYSPPRPYLGELKIPLLLFDDDNRSDNKNNIIGNGEFEAAALQNRSKKTAPEC